jgi:hypothetical protein
MSLEQFHVAQFIIMLYHGKPTQLEINKHGLPQGELKY